MRLAPIMQAFFTDYLMTQRHASRHTIASYRDCLRLLLTFAHQRTGKLPAQLDLAASIHVSTVLTDGISHLPYERTWTITWGHWAQPDRHVVLGRHAF